MKAEASHYTPPSTLKSSVLPPGYIFCPWPCAFSYFWSYFEMLQICHFQWSANSVYIHLISLKTASCPQKLPLKDDKEHDGLPKKHLLLNKSYFMFLKKKIHSPEKHLSVMEKAYWRNMQLIGIELLTFCLQIGQQKSNRNRVCKNSQQEGMHFGWVSQLLLNKN